jgi:PHD/YefM family antitoxin component YafN of YafNO toxin-antitoxin module
MARKVPEMKLKLDANGNAVLQDGKPVYVHDDGKEVAFDAPATVATISRINGEAKSHRERAEAAEAKLKPFEGITDPVAAIKALATVRNLDDKKLVDAGEVEKVKQEAIKAVRAEFEPVVVERDKLKNDLYGEKIGGSFARSKFIAEKAAIPADMVQARFGSNFTIKDGRVVAKDTAGNEIYSKVNPGNLADFDEALEILIDQYPYKAQILKGSGASGGGASGSGSAGTGGKRTITRAQFTALNPADQAKAAKEAVITD